jgi:hypothetical protein
MMTEEKKELEYKMYYFVPYNISPMQQGIQHKHAADEFLLTYGRHNPDHIVWEYMEKHKTTIVLNGGTTNNRFELGTGTPVGTLNQIVEQLQQNAIEYGYFQEPDLNDALTAVCFLADERVWNYEDYPDFLNWIIQNYLYDEPTQRLIELRLRSMLELTWTFPEYYKEWVVVIGGEKNVFLRELIRGKKLA